MNARPWVAVAMSGGVDSSVAAALLVERGERVLGLMLRFWAGDDGGNRCCSPEDVALARKVAGQLGVPFYVLDAQDPFQRHVVDPFIRGYAQGRTPNPCLSCNRHIRWGLLLDHALTLGAVSLATGHYARLAEHDGRRLLLRARDRQKDQSYVLSVMSQAQLSRAVFPLAELTKQEVREHARRLSLPVADRPESQDLCFVGEAGYREFLSRSGASLPPPGAIHDRDGRVLGRHTGLAEYTIGQRKGLGISAPAPLYVLEKDLEHNVLIVGGKNELGREEFEAGEVRWIDGQTPKGPLRVSVRVRYKAREYDALVTPLPGQRAHVQSLELIPDVTPGQAAVFYERDGCLGGGIILE